MSSKVKDVLEKRVEFLDADIRWYERVLEEQQEDLTETAQKLDGYRAEREVIQAHIEDNFPTDVVLEQLQKTREVLEERGRTKKKFIDSETCEVCLLGAAGIAAIGDEFEKHPSYYPFYNPEGYGTAYAEYSPGAALGVALAMNAELPFNWRRTSAATGLYEFNDHPSTTDEDVFDLIDRAIETRKAAA